MLIDEFFCKREVLGKRAPHSFTPLLSVVGVSNKYDFDIKHIKGKDNKVVDALIIRVNEFHATTISMYQ